MPHPLPSPFPLLPTQGLWHWNSSPEARRGKVRATVSASKENNPGIPAQEDGRTSGASVERSEASVEQEGVEAVCAGTSAHLELGLELSTLVPLRRYHCWDHCCNHAHPTRYVRVVYKYIILRKVTLS